MKLIDNTTLVEIALPDSLLWVDELKWSPSVSAASYSLTGALIMETATRLAGRPITLEPPDDSMAWVTRSVVASLRTWAADAGRLMTLVLEYPDDTRQFTVMFRHYDGAIEASPVKGFPEHGPNDWFNVSLKLIEV